MQSLFGKNLAYLLLGLSIVVPARASSIINSYFPFNSAVTAYVGQSFTTPAGGPWVDIRFALFQETSPTMSVAYAAGTAYIFTSAYTGTPSGLSSASDLATSTGVSSGFYVFNPSFTLQPGTTYFLYEDTNVTVAVGYLLGGSGGYVYDSTANRYIPSGPNFNYQPNYVLTGDVVPEPGTIGLLFLGALFILLRALSLQWPSGRARVCFARFSRSVN